MADDPHPHNPGRAPIEPKKRGHETNESPADESLDRREIDHVESPGHVERELPKDDVSRR